MLVQLVLLLLSLLLLMMRMLMIDLVQDKLYFVGFLKQLVVVVELAVLERMLTMKETLKHWIEMMMDVVVHVLFVVFHH
jgi:thiaminase